MTDEHDVDHLLRTARADVARLALQMRAARRAVDPVEVEAPTPEEPSLTAADLGVRPDADPPGLAEDLARVRADALRLLSSARAEVAQRVATSNDDALQLLQGPAVAPGAPNLRVAVPPAAPAEVPLPVAVVTPAPDSPATPIEEPAEAVTEAIPVVAPEAVSVVAPAAAQPMVPAALAAASAAVAAVPAVAPATAADPLGGVVVVVTVPQAGVPMYPVPAYAPAPAEEKRPASKVLYADVVLPILAVVVLLIILLAWVG